MSNVVLWSVADDLRSLALIIENYSRLENEPTNEYPKRGTVVRAIAEQDRFKSGSMWVSNGDGSYTHLTGRKQLTASHSRLEGYTEVIFQA